jgi:chromosome segregation ATPase
VGVVIVSSGDKERVDFYMPDDLFREMENRRKLLDKSRSEYLRDLIREDTTLRTPEEIRDQINKLEEQKREVREELNELDRKKEKYQSKLEKYEQREQEFEEALNELIEDARERPRILKHADKRLHHVAKKGGITKNELQNRVLDELDADDPEEVEMDEPSENPLEMSPEELNGEADD